MVYLSKIEVIAKEKKMTLKEVAEGAGISYQGLNKIIRSNSTKIETLVSISGVLGVSPCVFFSEGVQAANDAAIDYLREKDQLIEEKNRRIEELVAENAVLKSKVEIQKKETVPEGGSAGCADVV